MDLLSEVVGLGPFEAVLARSERFDVFGLEMNVLSLEGLIAAKRAASRPKDFIVFPQLEVLRALRDDEP